MTGISATERVIDVLMELNVPYMVVGSLSTNVYGVARGTQDADFVVCLEGVSLPDIVGRLGPQFQLDPQMTFETVTMTYRFKLSLVGTPFTIELFLLSDDEFDRLRFSRRRLVEYLDRRVYVPTAEDTIVAKLRWGRKKDLEDVRTVIAVQRDGLDWDYITGWCSKHGSDAVLLDIRRQTDLL